MKDLITSTDIYDSNLNPKSAVDLLKSTLKNKAITPNFYDN